MARVPSCSRTKLFEISDVVLLDTTNDVGARNVRRICASYTGHTDGFEVIHEQIDRIFQLLGIPSRLEGGEKDATSYAIVPSQERTFFEGRSADIVLYRGAGDGKPRKLGSFGVLHPDVLHNFELLHPTSVVEMDLEPPLV